ncbi:MULTISPECIES: hypothetical protein [Streptomyces]|nr:MULTISPECIES: hypothetical protein [Streptomyces]MBD3575580.1 hypothetical protein [Streptomyces sp. KD18]GGT21799.1 hypothetical protein GCM10010286_54110 [Streptomyces toxytricini]
MASTETKTLQKTDMDALKALVGDLDNAPVKKSKQANGRRTAHHHYVR